jgi:hypothetical protein
MRTIHWTDIALPFLAFSALWLTTPPIAASVGACASSLSAVAGKYPLAAGANANPARRPGACQQVLVRTAQ